MTRDILQRDLRVELQCQGVWYSAQTKYLSHRAMVAICAGEIEPGQMANVLLYVPQDEDFWLFKMRARVRRSTNLQGVFEVELALTDFAPGDERKFNLWWQGQLRQDRRRRGLDTTRP